MSGGSNAPRNLHYMQISGGTPDFGFFSCHWGLVLSLGLCLVIGGSISHFNSIQLKNGLELQSSFAKANELCSSKPKNVQKN